MFQCKIYFYKTHCSVPMTQFGPLFCRLAFFCSTRTDVWWAWCNNCQSKPSFHHVRTNRLRPIPSRCRGSSELGLVTLIPPRFANYGRFALFCEVRTNSLKMEA